MVRLRTLASDFHHPDQVRVGAQMQMRYLADMHAFQQYMDGDLSLLYQRQMGNEITQDITGAIIYKEAENKGFFELNTFLSVNRTVLGTAFEQDPKPLDGDDAINAEWDKLSAKWTKASRQAVEWRAPKGRSVWVLEKQVGGQMELIAWDPQYYIPIVDTVNRDKTLGHILWRPWWSGERVLEHNFPDMVDFSIYIGEEEAAMSDGRFGPMNEMRRFRWAGTLSGGVVASTDLEEETMRVEDNPRIVKIWTSGDDDSVFKSMERTAYELILAMSNARTALTQDIRSTRIVPKQDQSQTDSRGNILLDRLRPEYRVPLDGENNDILGYLDPPGPLIATSFFQLVDLCLDNLAYAANTPRETFGVNTNDSQLAPTASSSIAQLQQTFKTWIVDIRDDMSRILSEAFKLVTGHDVFIGWEHEPYVINQIVDQRVLAYHKQGLISDATAQAAGNWPIEQVSDTNNSQLKSAQSMQQDRGGALNDNAS